MNDNGEPAKITALECQHVHRSTLRWIGRLHPSITCTLSVSRTQQQDRAALGWNRFWDCLKT